MLKRAKTCLNQLRSFGSEAEQHRLADLSARFPNPFALTLSAKAGGGLRVHPVAPGHAVLGCQWQSSSVRASESLFEPL